MKTYKFNTVQLPLDLTSVKTPQVRQLANIITDHMGEEHGSESVAKLLCDNKLQTRQDPYLIFKYYQRELVNLGLLVIAETKKAIASKFSFVDGAGI